MENVSIDDVRSLCGTAQSISFKFYPNDDNIRMCAEFAKESHESLWTFMCNTCSLVLCRMSGTEDQSMYYHCKPDGYCAMRVWRLATLFVHNNDSQVPADVNLTDVSQRSEFAAMIQKRYNEIETNLNEEEKQTVLRVLDFLAKGIN